MVRIFNECRVSFIDTRTIFVFRFYLNVLIFTYYVLKLMA